MPSYHPLPSVSLHPDVAFSPTGAPVVAYQHDGHVAVAELNLDPFFRAPCSGLAFARLWTEGRTTWLAYRDPTNHGRLVDLQSGLTVDLGPAWGNDPLCFGPGAVYCQGTDQVRAWDLAQPSQGVPIVVPLPRPTGLSHVVGGRVVLVDEARLAEPGLTRPSYAGGYVVGEGGSSGAVVREPATGAQLTLWAGQVSKTPRLAHGQGRLLVAKWEPGAVAQVRVDELRPVVPAPPPPPPPPPPTNEDLPMSVAIVKAWRARYDAVPPGKVRGLLISNGTAWQLRAAGVGLLDKRSGTDSTVAYDGKHFPADIIVESDGDHYDILQDGDGAATPTWQPKGKIPSAWRWVPPYDPAVLERAFGIVTEPPVPNPPPVDPPPPPPPPPPSTGDPIGDEVLTRLRSIDQTLLALARHLGVR